ncbi:MAG TPA: hypothetical protein VNA88_06870 [Candidatus Kapabacteria bacterium]|jgi:hypothetical protein|nr:hypothetical protein [Candidatus Kapabacteria bacterium]
MHLEAMWYMGIENLGPDARAIRLYGIAFESRTGRRIADGLSDVFEAPPGMSTVNPADISPIDYDADPDYEEAVLRTGRMPSGEYTICVYAIDERTRDTLGRDCITEHVVLNVTPPQLIYPRDGSTVAESRPLFTWAPVSPVSADLDITYGLRIVEIVGRQSPLAAMESNPPWYEEDGLAVPLCPYPLSAELLEAETRYAWQVIARTEGGERKAGELARSEVWEFLIREQPGSQSDSNLTELDTEHQDSQPDVEDTSRPSDIRDKSEPSTRIDDPLLPIETTVAPTDATVEGLQREILFAPEATAAESPSKKRDTVSPGPRVFAALLRSLDAGYQDVVGYLRFIYDNGYGPTEVTCKIYDAAFRDVTPSDLRLRASPGRNYFEVDLRKATGLADGSTYLLVVMDPRGERLQNRFVFHHCPKCPDTLSKEKPRE